ncbi:MAG TPA: hypothetical protein PKW35_18460, partial [Nannocystaceae bacterium]|nr:hypothetical protein [Nannocystaceae bacterium]
MTESSPLLALSARIPFDAIEAEHVEPAIEALLDDARQALDRIVGEPGPRTFANTLGALDAATEALDAA